MRPWLHCAVWRGWRVLSRRGVDRRRGRVPGGVEERRFDFEARLELLEPRLLLSTTMVEKEAPTEASTVEAIVAAPLADVATVSTTWAGHHIEAIADEWIIHYNEKKLSEAKLLKKLRRFGGLKQVTLTMTATPGVALLEAPMSKRARLLQFARKHAAVKVVEPNALLTLHVTPSDDRFGSLWGLNNTGQSGGTPDADIDAPEAWNITTGSRDVVIAVIDTGVDWTHPDLVANLWWNDREIPGNGIDDDGNGFVDDVRGWDFVDNDADPMDINGHGTHVAGTIGAVGNNGFGVVGVSWNVTIMPLRFIGSNGRGSTSDAIQAVNYATMMKRDYGVNVVATNNSWGGGGYSTALRNAINAAAAQDILFIAAAGNGDDDGRPINNDTTPHYPASYSASNIISVAATDRRDQLASWSNYGATTVHLAAPGVSILSTTPGNRYSTYNGTSMAAPHVSGVVALLAAANPNASAAEIKAAILNSVDPLPSLAGKTVTGGRLNAYEALLQFAPPPQPAQVSGIVFHDTNGNGQRNSGEPLLSGRTVYLDLNGNNIHDAKMGTFTSSGPVSISPVGTSTVSSPIVVSGLGNAPITRVRLSINVTHTWVGDLEAYLVSPSGTYVQLFSRIGGSSDNFSNTVFDDEASLSVRQGSAPWLGTYRPEQALAAFKDETADGEWRLEIRDLAHLDGGMINQWTLQVWTEEPVRTSDAQGRYTFDDLSAGVYRVAQLLPDEWVQTRPSEASHVVTLAEGQSITNANFGSYALHAPVADAGGPYTIKPGEVLTLDGSASFDEDAVIGDTIVSYAWDLDNDGQFDDAFGVDATVTWSTLAELGLSQPGQYTAKLRVTDSYGLIDVATTQITISEAEARVVGRHLFYNRSYHDGRDAGANANDDLAIAPDKEAYRPGSGPAKFVNYSSYSRGINGIMVDIANLPDDVTVEDFVFRVGNSNDLSTWSVAPVPVSITVRRGDGVDGSDRVTIIWTDGAISKQWLEVTVRATERTRLAEDDVFYFGNAVGDTGSSASNAEVNALDMGWVRANFSPLLTRVGMTNVYDFNRDGYVDSLDFGLARNNVTDRFTRLILLDV